MSLSLILGWKGKGGGVRYLNGGTALFARPTARPSRSKTTINRRMLLAGFTSFAGCKRQEKGGDGPGAPHFHSKTFSLRFASNSFLSSTGSFSCVRLQRLAWRRRAMLARSKPPIFSSPLPPNKINSYINGEGNMPLGTDTQAAAAFTKPCLLTNFSFTHTQRRAFTKPLPGAFTREQKRILQMGNKYTTIFITGTTS